MNHRRKGERRRGKAKTLLNLIVTVNLKLTFIKKEQNMTFYIKFTTKEDT